MWRMVHWVTAKAAGTLSHCKISGSIESPQKQQAQWVTAKAAGSSGHWKYSGSSAYKKDSCFDLYWVVYKFSEEILHQERSKEESFFSQSQMLHRRIVSKSLCVSKILPVKFSDHQQLSIKWFLVRIGQFMHLFQCRISPFGLKLLTVCITWIIPSLLWYVDSETWWMGAFPTGAWHTCSPIVWTKFIFDAS